MVYKIENTEETLHEGCAQYASWNIGEFDTDTGCGFLVQEVNMVITIDMNTESTHYFEAWKIEDGKIVQSSDIDDVYCRGDYRSGFDDTLSVSIGHCGKVAFYPRVFWVEKETVLYDKVLSWDSSVTEANGLRSVYLSEEWEAAFKEIKVYEREPFIHTWDFRDPEVICHVIIEYCEKMYRTAKCGEDNFNLLMNDITNAVDRAVKDTGRTEYLDVVHRVKEDWNSGKA